jgi:hypothetical protein
MKELKNVELIYSGKFSLITNDYFVSNYVFRDILLRETFSLIYVPGVISYKYRDVALRIVLDARLNTLHSKNYCCKMSEVNQDALIQKTNLVKSSKEVCHSKGSVSPIMMKM